MRVVLAISGGIDSMVMLDIFGDYFAEKIIQQYENLRLYGCARPSVVVATLDHGTRPSAKDDVMFVRQACGNRYFHVPCFTSEGDLGEYVSEAAAREQRYSFLYAVANKIQKSNGLITIRPDYDESQPPSPQHEPTYIYTAHHLDDLVESIAINLIRGTGWRGLAVMDAPGVRRPFLEPELLPPELRGLAPFDKNNIRHYAVDYEITHRQDPTNYEDTYLRNRLRQKLVNFEHKLELYHLWQKQKQLKREINQTIQELLPAQGEPWQRSWFNNLDPKVAIELLRAGTLRANIPATRPQLENFYHAIKTYAPGKAFNLPNDHLVKFSKDSFVL